MEDCAIYVSWTMAWSRRAAPAGFTALAVLMTGCSSTATTDLAPEMDACIERMIESEPTLDHFEAGERCMPTWPSSG